MPPKTYYFARYIAKNIVAAGLADKCEIQLAFAIGISKPVAFFIETFNTNKVDMEIIYKLVNKHFDLTVNEFFNKYLK